MAKAPVAGTVKTRLSPPLTAEEAAAVAAGFVLDTWASAREAFGDRLILSYAGRLSDFPLRLRAATAVCQTGNDLGARIESAIDAALSADRESPPRAIVIGSDLPLVPPSHLTAAAQLLDTADICIGPSADGGYYLIGARRWQPGLLEGLPWSASNTAEATCARLRERGYAVAMAQAFNDIDEPAELAALSAALAADPSAAPNTAAVLKTIAGG